MAHIKKLVMHGFKSFPKKTELPFTSGINVILGPNGSGKSNVSDALCFVLGRLSIKSMRAAKAKNLIFLGTKAASPSKEASVEIVFDNSDGLFAVEEKDMSIKRIVRRNGQSVYKINDKTKTRQEVLGLLAQAGIDPYGFNIILQGEIQNFVRMQPDDRRKIIEEVAGISIYESRKEKSLKELDKTENRLKEVNAILRERTAYLNNLEKERQEALRFKKLEKESKQLKASIIDSSLKIKERDMEGIDENIGKKNKEIEKVRKIIGTYKASIKSLEQKIESINSNMKESTGLEQEKLNNDIANLRADLAGLKVKYENNERKLNDIRNQKKEFENSLTELKISLRELKVESPSIAKKEKELLQKKKELEEVEEKRKKFYMLKSEIKSLQERIEDKRHIFSNYENESDFLLKQINNISLELHNKKMTEKNLEELRVSLGEKITVFEGLKLKEQEIEKMIYTNEYEIDKQKKVMEKVSKIDTCPLCRSKITHEHVSSIKKEINPKVKELEDEIKKGDKELGDISKKKELLERDIDSIKQSIAIGKSDLLKIKSIDDKKSQIKSLMEKINPLKEEIEFLNKKRKNLENNFDENSNIDEKYENLRMEVEDISLRSKENLDSEITFKQREFERAEISLKQLFRDEKEIEEELDYVKKSVSEKERLLEKKRKMEEEITQKFQKLIIERDSYQSKIRETETTISQKNNYIYNIEQDINNFKIDRARVGAEMENLEEEMKEFAGVGIIKGSREILSEKLRRVQETLLRIGSVNMRALEVYDSVKEEYDKIHDKVEIISKEKEKIMKIIHDIDIKKKKTFVKTLEELNEIFSRNFSQLSTKGQVSLELENKKDPFEAGVNIIVKTGHGKYFDVKSLSGGEQTLVALSLIFAIQELKPYCFYILDEIDAALDKRNSERLGNMLKKYMQQGQYIVISHNDEIISNATNIFGISMHDGVSKVVSLSV
jgi:chromosome segregation protein